MITRTRLVVLFSSLLLAAGNLVFSPFASAAPADNFVAGIWYEFHFTASNLATGCRAQPGYPGGTEAGGSADCGPIPGTNAVFAPDMPWLYTPPAGGATLTVQDAGFGIDSFNVFDISTGTEVQLTQISARPGTESGACDLLMPDACAANLDKWQGVFALTAGHQYSIKIVATHSDNREGMNYFRIDVSNANDHFVCYHVKHLTELRLPDVAMTNQFGAQTFMLKDAEMVCVPSSKEIVAPQVMSSDKK